MNKLQRFLARKLLGLDVKAAKTRYEIVGGRLVTMADDKRAYVNEGYSVNDTVYSVVNLILDKVRIAPWTLFKVVDESSLKSLNGLMNKKDLSPQDYRKILSLHKKALEPISKAGAQEGKLIELLKWANEYETFGESFANGCGYKLLTGDRYLWGDLLDGGANMGLPNSLWNMPSQEITIIASNTKFPVKEIGYQMTCWGTKYSKEEVMHEKYWNPQWGVSSTELHGMSPLKALAKRLTKSNAALDAASAKYQNNGLEAIIYVDDDRMSGVEAVEQAEALKSKLIQEYTGPKNQGKMATSGYRVGVANLGLSPVELGILESEVQDVRMICNAFGIPSQLLNDPENKSYNNQKEGEKALTTRSALPLLTSFRDNFNRKLQSDWGFKGKNIYVDFGMEVFTELQADIKEIAEWTGNLIAISPNDQRELVGLPREEDEVMDEPWIKQDRQPLSDYLMNDVDKTLNDEQMDNIRGNNGGKDK